MRRGPSILLLALAAASCARNAPTTPAPEASPVVETIGTQGAVGYARVEWIVRDGLDLAFVIERRHDPQPWKVRATLSPDPRGRMTLEDPTVSTGERYEYRVRVPGGNPEYQGAVSVTVPR